MLPQLATETFSSQVFWVVLGFICVYGFMSCFAVPKLKKILEQRQSYVDELITSAQNMNSKSKQMEQESRVLLTKTKKQILEAEFKLIEELERTTLKEKQKLSTQALATTKKEIEAIQVSSEEAFEDVSGQLNDIIELALTKMENR